MKYFLLIFMSFQLQASDFKFSVLHTNDLHSYVEGIGPDSLFTNETNDGDPVLGNYSRLTTLIKNKREELKLLGIPNLLLDAGDFYAGTLFQILGPNSQNNLVPELDFFIHNNYDFSTIGNHEFDAKSQGFETMLRKIDYRKKNFKILASNIIFKNKKASLQKFYSPYNGIEHNKVLTNLYTKDLVYKKQKKRVGFIGIMGPNASQVSLPNRENISFIGFNDKTVKPEFDELYKHLDIQVNELKKKYKVDLIIVIMHAGSPEDKMIAENVKGIDLIIAGHTHELYKRPKIIKKTLIAQVRCYGNYLGHLNFTVNKDRIELDTSPTFTEVNDSIETDPTFNRKVQIYKHAINKKIKKYGYKYNTPIFKTNKPYKRKSLESHNKVGSLVATGIFKEFNLKEKKKIHGFFTTMGLIRADILAPKPITPYQFSDTYKFLPLGISDDGDPGFPIVTFYMHKDDVLKLVNFLETYKYISSNYTPVFSSNIKYNINQYGIPFLNRVQDFSINDKKLSELPTYLHIATTSYVAGHVNKVGPMTYGLVNFSAHDKEGNLITKPYMTKHKGFQLFSNYMEKLKVLE